MQEELGVRRIPSRPTRWRVLGWSLAAALVATASAPDVLAQTKPPAKPPAAKPKPKPKPPADPAADTSSGAGAAGAGASGAGASGAGGASTSTGSSSAASGASTDASGGGAPGSEDDKDKKKITDDPAFHPTQTEDESTDVTEAPGKAYYFIGLRYRGNIVPKFMLNIFVDEGKTVYSNTLGVEVDIRKDDFSLIPAISYVEYGTGDILFKEKSKPSNIIGNYSIVNSSLKGIYLTADLLWGTKIHKNIDFEYGAGFGLGILFGDLINNWVLLDATGPVAADDGRRFRYCQFEGEGGRASGCNKVDHQNASIAKVGGYNEPSWVNGGSKPNVFPWIGVPQIGLRFKPLKQLESRLSLGFSLTGFWFGLSANYGLERPEKKTAQAGVPELRFH